MLITDRSAIDQSSQVRLTQDGYLVAMPRVARTGIQVYSGSEVGVPTMDTVRVYRPPNEVFDRDSMRTFAHRPITDDHPPGAVDSSNWKDFAVGNSGGEIARDGEFMRVPMVLMDKAVIEKIKDGKSELSVGYSTELKWENGVTPAGETYDAIQTSIRVNHIAVVDAARGGPKLRIGDTASDHQTQKADAAATLDGGQDMTTEVKKTTLTVDGVSLEMPEVAAQVVQRTVSGLNDKLATATAQVTTLTQDAAKAKTEHEAAIAKLATDSKTEIDKAKAEIETLKKQVSDAALTPEKLEALVKDRAELLGKAKAVLGDKLVIKDQSDAAIRKQVVSLKMGDAAKDWSDDQVKVSFDTITATITADTTSGVVDSARAFAFNTPTPGTMEAKNKMYSDADRKLSDRWKNGGAKVA